MIHITHPLPGTHSIIFTRDDNHIKDVFTNTAVFTEDKSTTCGFPPSVGGAEQVEMPLSFNPDIYIYFIVILGTWVKFEKTPSTKLRGSTASVFCRFYIKKRIGVLPTENRCSGQP